MTAPATINPGSILTYTASVHNAGPAAAPQVLIADTLPAAFVSATSSQGVCAGTLGTTSVSCNLGAIAVGATATFTVSVQLPATAAAGTFTNTATASVQDATGANLDPNLANNTSSASTSVGAQPSVCTGSNTDIQVVGAASNGNPVHGTPVTFTWQIKNNLGSVPASCVTFNINTTAPAGQLLSISATTPGASTVAPSCTINATSTGATCALGTINGGGTSIVTVTAIPSAAGPAKSYSMTGNAQLGAGTDTNPANNASTIFIGAQ
jgi:uncharacterized repeat protein (TIGR01451 family)